MCRIHCVRGRERERERERREREEREKQREKGEKSHQLSGVTLATMPHPQHPVRPYDKNKGPYPHQFLTQLWKWKWGRQRPKLTRYKRTEQKQNRTDSSLFSLSLLLPLLLLSLLHSRFFPHPIFPGGNIVRVHKTHLRGTNVDISTPTSKI